MSLNTSLQAAYTYENGGNLGLDSSANANNLTNNNAATQVAGNAVPGTKGVNLAAASSQSLSIASNASLVMGGTSWEIAIWWNPTSLPGAGFFPGIIGKWGAGSLEYLLWYDGTASRMKGSATADGSTVVTVEHTNAPLTGTWIFLDLYFDLPNQTLNLRVNDAPAIGTPSAALTDTFAGTAAFVIGSTAFGAPWINAVIDGTEIYKRLLTPTERTQLYRAGAGLESPFPGTGATRRHTGATLII
jgi:hypothetical protein